MSYDFEVYADDVLTLRQTQRLIERTVRGRARQQPGGGLLVTTGILARYLFTVEPPVESVYGDRPSIIPRSARWRTTILVEGGGSTGITRAQRFSKRLANAVDGVAIDLQTGESWRSSPVAAPPDERKRRVEHLIEVIDLHWACRGDSLLADPTRVLVGAANASLPIALPRRFGSCEPLRGRFAEVGELGFSEAWKAETMLLHIKGTTPCVGGYVSAAPSATRGARFWTAQLTFLAEPFHDAGLRRRLREFFVTVADDLPTVLATATVEGDHIWTGQTLRSGAETEYLADPGSAWGWTGLPPEPRWWTWFGQDYSETWPLLPHAQKTMTKNGAFFSAHETPARDHELSSLIGMLPPDLFAHRDPNYSGVYPPYRLAAAERIPAALL